MPYDPSLPLPNSPLESQVIRDQLQSLFVLIHSLVTVNTAQVDSTSTLPPGSPANASVSVIGHRLHFSFEIPQGLDGIAGPAGLDGAVGPPFAQAVVDSVTTLNPGDSATVGVSFDGSNVRFNFGIPRGSDGSNGTNGNDGSNGSDGSNGAPGEVTSAQLSAAISGTSNTSNSVSTLDNAFGDPASEELRNKVNELINALRR